MERTDVRISITYFADGTFKLLLYEPSCKAVEHEAIGTWKIKDGELHTQTAKSVGIQQRLRAGAMTKDKVVSVDQAKMVLVNDTGVLLHRTRGEPCRRK
jgi:hypothetical protein